VQNFDKSKVMAHERVAQFYNSLYSVNKALQHPKVAKAAPTKKAKTYEEEFLKSEVSQARGYAFDDDEEEAMAAYG
jgi:ATP-dependent DNA helicase PIF1